MGRTRDWAAQQERERLREQKAQERLARAMAARAKLLRVESGEARVQELNEQLRERLHVLGSLLQVGLSRDPSVDFSALKDRARFEPPEIPSDVEHPVNQPELASFMPRPLSVLGRLFGKKKHERAVKAGQEAFIRAQEVFREREQRRQTRLEEFRSECDRLREEFEANLALQHAGVEDLKSRYVAGDAAAVAAYCELVLAKSPYPEGFPTEFRLAYVRDSRQLVVEYQLPLFDVVPEEGEFRYIKTKDEVAHTSRKLGERRGLYAEIVSAVAIRTLYELFRADRGGHIDVVVFNGFVETIDPGTGKNIRPYLVTVRGTREEVEALDLSRVDPVACLRHLKAQVSRSPSELQPVRPIVDFNMVDPRFIEHGDVLTELDSRPNLMELTPGEFETLVTNLFEKMGLETKLTQASRDGGVDCVAYDQRPILGGKVVIQAKRYQHTVGVSAVRDLFGTMHNEGANKGILVTTSGYGKAAFEFANGKPIELIDGSNLLYLLSQQGVEARIEIPEGWQDPTPPV